MADRKGSVSSRVTTAAVTTPVTAPVDTPPTNTTSNTAAVAAIAAMSNVRASSPYGTRSRNRGARVNYAEDKDNEMDFELSANYNPTPPTSKAAGDATASGPSRRQPAAAAVPATGKDSKDGKDAAQTAPPATTTTTNSAAGKKRKGGAAAAAAAAQLAISSMTKDASLTNMLSFDRPHLKDGRLISDDGTVFEVHGT